MIKWISLVFFMTYAASLQAQKVVQQQEMQQKKDHFSLGVGAGFGLGMEKDDSDAGIAAGVFVEPSYTIMLDPWSISEFSVEVSSGKVEYEVDGEDVEIAINYMALIQAGYGYSLGDRLYAIFKVGVGPAQAEYEAGDIESEDSSTGVAVRLSAGLRMLTTQNIDLTFGIRGTYVTFDFDLPNNGDVDSKLTLPEAYLAARIKI